MRTSRSRRPLAVLGAWLLSTLAVSFLFLGAVAPSVQAGLHLMVAAGAGLVMFIPARKLEGGGAAVRWGMAGALPLGALALGGLPVPAGVARFIAPGLVAARPDDDWLTLSAYPDALPGEIATGMLVVGFGGLVSVWVAARYRREETETVVIAAVTVLAVTALVHAVTGAEAVFGLIMPEYRHAPFFAPFVNSHHASSVMLLGAPIAAAVALRKDEPGWKRRAAVAAFIATVAVIAWDHSSGALVAGGAIGVAWLLSSRQLHPLVLALGAAAALGVEGWAGNAAWARGSVASRAGLWADTLGLYRDFWLAGSGGGSFPDAVRAYRSDGEFQSFAHAHSDPLEWLAETGAVGVVAGGLALALVWPGPLRDPRRGLAFALGLLGLGLHACVEFPLQIPAIALLTGGMLALLFSVFGQPRVASPQAVRAVVVLIGLAQVPAAGVQLREALIASAVADVRGIRLDPEAAARGADRLEWLLAGHPERGLYAAWAAEHANEPAVAVAAALQVGADHPDRPDILRDAAMVLARSKEYAAATKLLERAAERDPSDYRPWILLARVARAEGDVTLAAERWAGAFQRSALGLNEAYAVFPLGLFWLNAFETARPEYSAALAMKLREEGDLEVALLACEQAARLDPETYGDLLVRSVIWRQLGRPEEAEPWLAAILERKPNDEAVLSEYGAVLTARGKHEAAAAAYLQGARSNPALRVQAFHSAEAAGGPQHALALARRFELDGTLDPNLGLEIARLQMREGDSVGCLHTIERWGLITSSVSAHALPVSEACQRLAL